MPLKSNSRFVFEGQRKRRFLRALWLRAVFGANFFMTDIEIQQYENIVVT